MKNTDLYLKRVAALEDAVERRIPQYARALEPPKTIDLKERSVEVTISTPTPDRYGDIVEPMGMDNADFRASPMIPWNHNYNALPVGLGEWERAAKSGVTAKGIFHERELSPEADQVFRYIAVGGIRTFSIGFLPKRGAWEEIKDENGDRTNGIRFLEWGLLEWSPTTIPANPEALANALTGMRGAAQDLGMEAPEARGFLARMAVIEGLLERYPELLEPDGLEGVVAAAVEKAIRSRDLAAARTDVQRAVQRDEALACLRHIKEACGLK